MYQKFPLILEWVTGNTIPHQGANDLQRYSWIPLLLSGADEKRFSVLQEKTCAQFTCHVFQIKNALKELYFVLCLLQVIMQL